MEFIVITHPVMLPREAVIINELFGHGLARLHVRKPEATETELRGLLEEIDPQFRGRIALHQHHELAREFGITGLHFTENNRLAQSREAFEVLKNSGFKISTSIHDPTDLETLPHYFDYAFLGPVFDSISKEGYQGMLPNGFQLNRFHFSGQVIALGGIDDTKLDLVPALGFDGAAVLGAIWKETANAVGQFRLLASSLPTSFGLKPGGGEMGAVPSPGLKPGVGRTVAAEADCTSAGSPADNQLPHHTDFEAVHRRPNAVHNPGFQPRGQGGQEGQGHEIAPIHFISNETGTMSHIDSIRLALKAGCRWIQLRVKDRPEEEVLPIAWEATQLCDRYGAKLIINDFPRVALAVEAYGLHLGLTDMPVPEARTLVGEKMVIGGTANTWEDIVRRIDEGADYIGLGPFRFTNTKQNLSPILGIDGYSVLMRQMQQASHSIPVIAIGGITPDDIGGLREAGIHGVAMSGALIGATDPQKTFYQIQQALC